MEHNSTECPDGMNWKRNGFETNEMNSPLDTLAIVEPGAYPVVRGFVVLAETRQHSDGHPPTTRQSLHVINKNGLVMICHLVLAASGNMYCTCSCFNRQH